VSHARKGPNNSLQSTPSGKNRSGCLFPSLDRKMAPFGFLGVNGCRGGLGQQQDLLYLGLGVYKAPLKAQSRTPPH